MTQYNKLVRDLIPDVIAKAGATCETRFVEGDELSAALLAKIDEEAGEFAADPCAEELGDLLEVLHGLAHAHGLGWSEVERARTDKLAARGGFERGVFLIEVHEP